MKVISILARYGTEKYVDAEEQLACIFSSQLQGTSVDLLIVDNSLPPEFPPGHQGSRRLIAGDNSSWEFSAWTKGIRFLGQEIWSYDLVHLATSAFRTLYTSYLERFDVDILRAIADRPVCVGHVDCYSEPVRLLSFRSQHWLRTSFIFIPVIELKALGSLVSITDREEIFGTDPGAPFSPSAPISGNYQKFILDWLTGQDIGQGSIWHSKIVLNERTFAFFKAKASAILNEHLFGLRLRAQGTKVLDTTWLATQLATREPAEIEWNAPWKRQLAERDRDRVVCG